MGNESEGVEKDEEFYQKREWTTDAPKWQKASITSINKNSLSCMGWKDT